MQLPNTFNCTPQDYYPGLRPNDVRIWDELLISNPNVFDQVAYNIKLGDPVSNEEDRDIMKATGMYDVSCWNIDIVGFRDNTIYIVEVKPDAKAGALGQALAYRELFIKEYKPDIPVVPVVLTDDIGPIMRQAAELLGVTLLTP